MGAVLAVPMADDPQITQITTHTINILRVAEGQRQAAVDRLQELQGEITTLLEKSEKLSPNRLNRLKALEEQTNESITQAYQDISGTHTAGLKKLAGIEAKQAQKMVNTKIGVDVVSVAIPEKLLEAVVDGPHIFGNSAKGWWGAQAEELQKTFKNGMQQGVLLGETVDQLAARVRGTKANSYEDGMMALKRRQAQALVRSSAISIANEARLRQFAEMGDLVKGIQWIATLDTRTTEKCRGLDGKMWRLPDYQPVGHDKLWPGPTAHWNCRSTQIAVLRSWEELSGKKLPSIGDDALEQRMKEILAGQGMSQDQIDKVKASTRASMDGQVSDGLDFEGWLRLQPDSRVEAILGPGRAALWKAGQLTVSDMTDQTNRPLTLDQLEQLVEKGGTAPETLGVQFLPMVSETVQLSAKTEAELNKKAEAEIEQIQEEADPDAKAKPTPPDTSAETIAAILASPAGQTLKAKWIQKIQKENPEMAPKDVLANATQQALMEQASKSKAAALSNAKKKLVAGEDLTPALQKTIDSLTPEEAANFNEAVENAKALTKAQDKAVQTAALAKLTEYTAKGWPVDDATAKILENVPAADVLAAADAGTAIKTAAEKAAQAPQLAKEAYTAAAASPDVNKALDAIPKDLKGVLTTEEKSAAMMVGYAQKNAKKAATAKAVTDAIAGDNEIAIANIPQADLDLLDGPEYAEAIAAGEALKAAAKAKAAAALTKAQPPDLVATTSDKLGDDLDGYKQAGKYILKDNPTSEAAQEIETALGSGNPFIVIEDGAGAIKGALHYSGQGKLNLELDGIGSMVPGGGTKLVKELAKVAAANNQGIVVPIDTESMDFWTKLGFEKVSAHAMVLKPSKVKALAGPLADPDPPKPVADDVSVGRPGPLDTLAIPQMTAMAKGATHHLKDADGTVVAVGEKKATGHVIAPKSLHLQKVALTMLKELQAKGTSYYQLTAGGGEFPNGQQSMSIGPNNYPIAKAIADLEASVLKLQAAEPAPAPAPTKPPTPTPAPTPGYTMADTKLAKKKLKPADIAAAPVSDDMKNLLTHGKGLTYLLTPDGKPLAGAKTKKQKSGAVYHDVYAETEAHAIALAKGLLQQAKREGIPAVVVNAFGKAGFGGKSQLNAGPNSFSKTGYDDLIAQLGSTPSPTPVLAPTPKPQVVTPATIKDPFSVPDPATMTFVKTLPGSTAPSLMKDATGKQWVVKEAKSVTKDHLVNEMIADEIYRAAGVDVPKGKLIGGKKVTEFLENAKTLGELKGTALDTANEELARNFVMDALMGNWDVVGAGGDNVLVVQGKPVRVDNGGALLFRAMGAKKLPGELTGEVTELKSLRDANINPRTAAVFSRLTKAEIDQQIRDVLSKRDAILDVASQDGDVYSYLEARFKWLEDQLPAEKASAASKRTARAATAAIPKNVATILKRKTTEGWVYDGDGDQIEDNRVLFWREKHKTGEVTKAQARLTFKGSDLLRDRLAAMGYPRKHAASIAKVATPDDVLNDSANALFDATVQAAKTINHHVGAGTPEKINPVKISTLESKLNDLKIELKALDSTAQGLGVKLQAAQQIAQAEAVLAKAKAKEVAPKVVKGEPTAADLKAWKAKNEAKVKAAMMVTPSQPTWADLIELERQANADHTKTSTVNAVSLRGWTISLDNSWMPVRKKRNPDGSLTPLDNGDVVTRKLGLERFTLKKGDIEVEFIARKPDDGQSVAFNAWRDGRAAEGNIEITVPGGAGPDTIQRALEAVADLGIPATPTTDAFKELLYIHRTVYQRNDHKDPRYDQIWKDETMPEAKKVDALKDWVEAKYKVKLPRGGRESWSDTYNPDGRTMGKDGAGMKEFIRWDVTEAEMLKELQGKSFTHSTGDIKTLVKGMLANGGIFTPTTERVRQGIDISAGQSAQTDLDSGGAIWLYTRLTDDKYEMPNSITWNAKAAMRQDMMSVERDVYGAKEGLPQRKSTPQQLRDMNGNGGDSGLFKNGLSILDDRLERITASTYKQREEILQIFRDAGITSIAGRPIESIVRSP